MWLYTSCKLQKTLKLVSNKDDEFNLSIALTAALSAMCEDLTLKECYHSADYFRSYFLIITF